MDPGDAVIGKHLEVVARRDESGDRMIKRFTKMVRNDGVLKEVMNRTYYEKPSIVKRRKRRNAIWELSNNNTTKKK